MDEDEDDDFIYEDDFYGPTDEFFYADKEQYENFIDEPYDALPFEDDCYDWGDGS